MSLKAIIDTSLDIWIQQSGRGSKQWKQSRNRYRGDTSERVTSLTVHILTSDEDWSDLTTTRPTKNAGWVGLGSLMLSFANMKTTEDIGGLSAGSPWTHNNPIWMNFNSSVGTHDCVSAGSINCTACSSHHSFHVCNVIQVKISVRMVRIHLLKTGLDIIT